MEQHPIPEGIRRFVLTSIPSVPFLEALLLLRADGARQWSAGAVAARLYVRVKVAQGLLDELCNAGMAAPCERADDGPVYRYQPESAQVRQSIDEVADLYAKQLVEMTHLIHSKLDRKAQQFADAFKWRKDPHG
jgi:hypothetical protein